ncbi:hypothetical protein AMJ39_00070 [candidate division TA06 bacterium DG_24]|jgi:hypothetical protein|uniref:Putative Se/S carrier protein-like domain-containing protein n=3 Tax=Bacteria division TA06 TaxID=1156500 RepID=A0A0S8JLX9_UNCT6|nr:MAG: hypothetical protein AMJ39_00070 [candidate division TA06 bacterium DG_24]KPK69845.1 MAG: hypothetical protein AMJ82_04535 [candidate division TA06 bacterium SM23_40]KPL10243.1 MAG: hypothetical protein AMJ71_03830 [candidate division TA06 bacterium SM1_40]
MDRPDSVINFVSVHHVMRAEHVFKEHGLAHEIIPTPRDLSSDCGIAIALSGAVLKQALDLLAGAGVEVEALYRRRGSTYERMPPVSPC